MCIPMLAAAAASPGLFGMTMGGTILTGAGAAMSALGAYNQSKAAQNMANYNAAVAGNNAQMAEWEAQDAQRRGEEEAQNIRRDADQLKGQQRATMAAKGLELTEGTSANLIEQTDFFSLVDQTTARNNAKRESWSARQRASGFRTEADMQRATAKAQSPGLAATTSLLGSAASVAQKWRPAATNPVVQ